MKFDSRLESLTQWGLKMVGGSIHPELTPKGQHGLRTVRLQSECFFLLANNHVISLSDPSHVANYNLQSLIEEILANVPKMCILRYLPQS